MINFSVLMSVYKNDHPSYFSDAFDSNTLHQNFKPKQFVLVVDGPVSKELQTAIESKLSLCDKLGISLQVVTLPINGGLAAALNAGLLHCTEEWIARADADDISRSDRFGKQVNDIINFPNVDVHFSYQAEFSGSPNAIERVKVCPTNHLEIKKALAKRCIVSHPSILIRRSILVAVGGYRTDVGFFEDYDLHFRLLSKGAIYKAIPEALVLVRVTEAQIARRGGFDYATNEMRARSRLFMDGHISIFNFLVYTPAYFIFRVSPSSVKRFFYRFVRLSVRT